MIVRFIFPLILCASSLAAAERPNVIIIFMDDMGYADPGCYRAKGFKTPEMDTMAGEGMRLTPLLKSRNARLSKEARKACKILLKRTNY